MDSIKICDVFDIKYGQFSTPIQKLLTGNTALITSGSKNNGIVGYYSIEPIYKNVLSVARTGSVGETFFHSYDCVITSDCMVLTPKNILNPQEIYWYILLIKKSQNLFSYSRKITPKRLGQILIPAKIPYWVYNTNLIELLDITKSINNLKIQLETVKWKQFQYDQIFDVKKGKRLTKSEMIEGHTPFIGAIDSNNGVSNFVGQDPIFEGNTITVNYDGNGVAESYYQASPYFALDSVNVLYPKFNLNPFIAMFLIVLIRKEKFRFNYGRKWHLGRMRESTIKLPVTPEGNPDWGFMENYIKSLPYSKSLAV
jgi:Type I restriction modification DNA specificity domain